MKKLILMWFFVSSCTTYKWRASALDPIKESKVDGISKLQRKCTQAGGNYDEETRVCRDVLVLTDIGTGDKAGCYLTFLLYGGWCWFINPSTSDKASAQTTANNQLGVKAQIEYLGVD